MHRLVEVLGPRGIDRDERDVGQIVSRHRRRRRGVLRLGQNSRRELARDLKIVTDLLEGRAKLTLGPRRREQSTRSHTGTIRNEPSDYPSGVLVLLPPSETKAAPPKRGPVLDLGALSFPELTAHRAQLIDALVKLSRGPATKARTTLKLSPGQTDELIRNAALREAVTTKVSALYTGVLYDALDLPTLSTGAKRRAANRLVVASALFGALRLGDRVPAYRLSGGVTLPRVGAVTTSWRAPLTDALTAAAGSGLVLDLRSSAYASMWQPTGELAERTLTVRVLHERVPGDPSSRAVVSHFNKATKGRLVRELLESDASPRTPEALAALLESDGQVVEVAPARPGRPRLMDLVVAEV